MKKSGHEMGMITGDEYAVLNQILNNCLDVNCFEFDGVIFLGEKIEVVKRYVKLSPSKSFYVWCHDNLPILDKITSNIKS